MQVRDIIERQVAHLARLVDDLLDVSAHFPRQGLCSAGSGSTWRRWSAPRPRTSGRCWKAPA